MIHSLAYIDNYLPTAECVEFQVCQYFPKENIFTLVVLLDHVIKEESESVHQILMIDFNQLPFQIRG